jgi:hypothetical protein
MAEVRLSDAFCGSGGLGGGGCSLLRTRLGLITCFLQGIFAKQYLLFKNDPDFKPYLQWVSNKFPKTKNRRFLAVIRVNLAANRDVSDAKQASGIFQKLRFTLAFGGVTPTVPR